MPYLPSETEIEDIRAIRQHYADAAVAGQRGGTAQPTSPLRDLLDTARQQVGFVNSYDATGGLRHSIAKPAASVSRHSLRAMELPSFTDGAAHKVHTPFGTEAGKRTVLSDAVLAASRCAVAGANILVIPSAVEAKSADSGEVFYQRENMRFDVIEAAGFSIVPDGDELTDSALPIHRAAVDLDTMPSLGVRIPLSRAEQRSYADGQLADATLASIALGIARAADAVLLSAIVAGTPAAFSLAAAAAAGFEFSELRALVGTAGTGATVGQDGTLRADGVLAELTPDTAATLVGSWSRAAVAVHEEIAITAQRTNVNSDLVLTCWCNMEALVPMPGAFWTVGA